MGSNTGAPGGVKHLLGAAGILLLGLMVWHGPLLFGIQALCGGDLVNQLYPMRHGQLEHGWFSGWAPDTFSGRPGLDDIQTGAFYPPNWLHLVHGPLERTFTLLALAHFFFGGFGFFLLCRQRLGFAAAMVAAFVWTFGGYQMLRLTDGVQVFVYTFAWIPWMWLAAERQLLERGPRLRWTLALGVFGALQVAAGAPQVVQMTWVGLAFWTAGRMVWRHSGETMLRLGGGFLLAGAIALLLAFPVLMPALDFQSKAFPRGADDRWAFLADGSLQPRLMVTWLFPDFFTAGNMEESYWGSRVGYHETNMFSGMAALVLALFAVVHGGIRLHREVDARFNYRDNLRWGVTLGVLSLFGLLVAFGEHGFLFLALTEYVPTFDFFRVPARWILWPAAAVAIGAGWGIEVLLRESRGRPDEPRTQVLAAWAAAAGAFVLIALIFRLFLGPILSGFGLEGIVAQAGTADPQGAAERLTDFARSSVEWGLLVAATTGLLGAAIVLRRFVPVAMLAILLALGAVDLLRFWQPFTVTIPTDAPPGDLITEAPYHRIASGRFQEHFYPDTPIVTWLRDVPGRVHYTDTLLTFMYDHFQRELLMERPAALGVPTTRGYQQLILAGYMEDYYRSLEPSPRGPSAPFLSHWGVNDTRFFDAYNVTHVLSYPAGGLAAELEELGLEAEEAPGPSGLRVFRNTTARGWAWVSAERDFLDAAPDPELGTVEVLERTASLWHLRVTAHEAPLYIHLAMPEHGDWALAADSDAPMERVDGRTVRITGPGEWEFERRWRPGVVPFAAYPGFLAGLIGAGCCLYFGRTRWQHASRKKAPGEATGKNAG